MAAEIEIIWNGVAATAKVRAAAVRGLLLSAEFLLSEANKLVPLDEATLQNSGRAAVDEEAMEGIVSYDTPYAVVQHERLDFVHRNGRQAKYLEQPWRENGPKFLQIIATQIKRTLGGSA